MFKMHFFLCIYKHIFNALLKMFCFIIIPLYYNNDYSQYKCLLVFMILCFARKCNFLQVYIIEIVLISIYYVGTLKLTNFKIGCVTIKIEYHCPKCLEKAKSGTTLDIFSACQRQYFFLAVQFQKKCRNNNLSD